MEYISFAADAKGFCVRKYPSSALLMLLSVFGTHDFAFFSLLFRLLAFYCFTLRHIWAARWTDGVLLLFCCSFQGC